MPSGKLFSRRDLPAAREISPTSPIQSPAEEVANWITHGAAGIASIVAAVVLTSTAIDRGEWLMIAGCALYGFSLVAVYVASTLSHLFDEPRWRQRFRALDQASIFLLIAGSCTPIFIRYLVPHGWGWTLPCMWACALAGAWSKLRGHRIDSVSLVPYVMLGWFPVLAVKPLIEHTPSGCLVLLLVSGGFNMLGILFLCWDERYHYFHAVWHLFVIAASVCTYAGILGYVV